MAKVYDALRRAESERKRSGGEPDVRPMPSAPAEPLAWEPESSVPPPPLPAEKPSLLSRIGAMFRRTPVLEETAGDLNKRRIALIQPDSYVAEQFRALRGRIDAIAEERPMKTIAITSGIPGEGKTTAAINLALVASLSVGRRVLLIDCDLRRPKIHRSLGVRPEAGLAEVLTDQASLDDAIVKAEGVNLELLAVRGRPQNPSELLGSTRMREIVAELGERYDQVILDTPAALGLPDAKTVADLCDGCVLVVRADVTREEDIHTMLEILDRRRVLGVVLNGTVADQGRYGYVS